MARENASIYLKIKSGDAEKNIANISRAFRQARQAAANAKVGGKEYQEQMRRVRELKPMMDAHNRQVRGLGGVWSRTGDIIKGVVGGGLVLRGLSAIGGALRNAANVVMDYQKANSDLNAVLGVTGEQTAALRQQQIALGSSTEFTASQAAEAQTELAKLGFTMRELRSVTPAVLSLASAAGTDLPNAAAIAGSTIRQFGLDASESQRVVDVMAKSFSTSALDIEKYSTAMASAGPVAASAGVSLERTTALLGTLADRGLDASTAGTSLRNMFLQMAKEGITFEQAMHKVRNATDQNAVALDMFGTRGATTAVILANNAESADRLTTSLENAAGAAEAMAEEKLNNLSGSITKLDSAYEGLILTLENGSGTAATFFKSMVDGVTESISLLQTLESSSGDTGFGIFDFLFGVNNPEKFINAGVIRMIAATRAEAEKWAAGGHTEKLQRYVESLEKQRAQFEEGTVGFKAYNAEIDRASKSLEKLYASQTSDSLQGRLQEIGVVNADGDGGGGGTAPPDESAIEDARKLQERINDAILKEEERLALAQQEGREQELLKNEQHFGRLIETAAGHSSEIARLRELEREQKMLIDAKYDEMESTKEQERAAAEQEALAKIMEGTATNEEMELAKVNAHYDELERLAREHGITSVDIAKEREDAITAISAEQTARRRLIMANAFNTALGGLMEFTNATMKEQGRAAAFSKKVAAVQNLVNQSVAISSGIKSAMALPFPANLASIGTTIGAVLSAFGSVSQLFSQAGDVPAYEKGTMSAKGGLSLVGEKGPELMNVPRGAQIFPADQTRAMMGGTFTGGSAMSSALSGSSGGASAGSANDVGALIAEVRSWATSQTVKFVQRDKDEFDERLSSTRRLVEVRKER